MSSGEADAREANRESSHLAKYEHKYVKYVNIVEKRGKEVNQRRQMSQLILIKQNLILICVKATNEYCPFLFPKLRLSDTLKMEGTRQDFTNKMLKNDSPVDYHS